MGSPSRAGTAIVLAAAAAAVVAAAVAAVAAQGMPPLQAAYAQDASEALIPEWIRTSAGWWADGSITDRDFLGGIEYLVGAGIVVMPPPADGPAGADASGQDPAGAAIPEWVKTSAGWWADGSITDRDFVGSLQYLMGVGLIMVDAAAEGGVAETEDAAAATAGTGGGTDDGTDAAAVPAGLEADLAACAAIARAYERLDCERAAEGAIEAHMYRTTAAAYEAGPVTFYYPGLGSEGNDLFMEGDQAILTVRMLAENTGSENVALSCTGPAICAYDVWDGSRSFKYSGMDFTNGQIVLKPGAHRVFNMLFGPNIGYGGTQFEHDPSRQYTFRISEPWGSAQIPVS